MCSMSYNVDHSKHSWKKKKPETKGNLCTPTVCLLPSMLHLRYSILLSLLPPPYHDVLFTSCALILTPFRTAVPFWGQTTWSLSGLSPKRGCGSKKVKPHPSSISTPSVWVCHPLHHCSLSFPGDSQVGVCWYIIYLCQYFVDAVQVEAAWINTIHLAKRLASC